MMLSYPRLIAVDVNQATFLFLQTEFLESRPACADKKPL